MNKTTKSDLKNLILGSTMKYLKLAIPYLVFASVIFGAVVAYGQSTLDHDGLMVGFVVNYSSKTVFV